MIHYMIKEEAKEILKENGYELKNMANDFKNDKEVFCSFFIKH